MQHAHEHEHHHCCHGHDAPADAPPGRYDEVPPGYAGTVYICPMHPEVRQPGPGSCPLCGMALEAESGIGEEDLRWALREGAEIASRRLWG